MLNAALVFVNIDSVCSLAFSICWPTSKSLPKQFGTFKFGSVLTGERRSLLVVVVVLLSKTWACALCGPTPPP